MKRVETCCDGCSDTATKHVYRHLFTVNRPGHLKNAIISSACGVPNRRRLIPLTTLLYIEDA